MISLIPVKVWQIISCILAAIIIVLSLSTYIKVSGKNSEIKTLTDRTTKLDGEIALARANNETLRVSSRMQNDKIDKLKIDLALAEKQYKIKEVTITKVIEKEKLVVRDLNETQDYIEAKRIANEIIESL